MTADSMTLEDAGMRDHHTIQAALRAAVQRFADLDAVIDPQEGGRRLSYAGLLDEADTAAAALIERGVQPGDRVALWAPNTWEWVVASLGVMFSGGVLVPINTRLRGYEAAHALAQSGARVMLTVNGFLGVDYVELLRRAGADLPGLADIVILRGEAHAGCLSYAALAAHAGQASSTEARRRSQRVGPDDTAAILFTSGTTGEPKGVMLGNEALLRSFDFYASNLGLRPGDRELAVPPYSHLFGMGSSMLSPLLRGAATVPFAVWDPATALHVIEHEAITAIPGAPAIFQSLLHHPDLEKFDVSSLRAAVTGATVIPEELVVEMRGRLGLSLVITGYGMTESSGCCTYTRPGDDARTVAMTSGCPVPGVQVRVVDDIGRDLPPGTPGEILIRGFNVMQGYFRNPAATSAAIDAEGWLHSGDIGVLDERGYLDVTSRKTDMFIVGGFNTYPAEVENAMLTHPAVASVAVVGVPDARLGEVGAAFVVSRPGESPAQSELLSWCRERLANYKVPRYVWFTDTLPMNAAGKVLKRRLRDRAADLLSPLVGRSKTMEAAQASRLQQAVDHDEIRQLLYTYARGVDRGDLDLIKSVFLPEATDHHGHYDGPALRFAKSVVSRGDEVGVAGNQHHITNMLIEVDADTACAESYFIAFQHHDDNGNGIELAIMGGRYLDSLERRDGLWGILRREVVSDWTRGTVEGGPWLRTTVEHGGFVAPGRQESDPSYGLFGRA